MKEITEIRCGYNHICIGISIHVKDPYNVW